MKETTKEGLLGFLLGFLVAKKGIQIGFHMFYICVIIMLALINVYL